MTDPMPENTNIPSSQIDGFECFRPVILSSMLELAVFEGWTGTCLAQAAAAEGIDKSQLCGAFPDEIDDVAAYWIDEIDKDMSQIMREAGVLKLKIREKVAHGVLARLDLMRPHKEASRRLFYYLAIPTNGPLGARLTWQTADSLWRGLGDRSTDFNYFSKRGILSGVWVSTWFKWLNDDSQDEAETKAFLDARIENVMQIEKGKAKIRDLNLDITGPIAALGRMRDRLTS